ncbi:hypothetical protein LINPERHAP2_LOCUS163 [Linum perenne]
MRPPNKEKGKAIATTSKKLAIAAEEIDKMRDDAYKLAIEGSSSSEYQFSYIPVTYQCVTVIEPRTSTPKVHLCKTLPCTMGSPLGLCENSKDVPKDVLKSELLKALEDGMSDDHSENSVNKDEEDGSLNDDLLDEDQPYEDMETNNGGDDA